ncbi:LTA synthase family protein [Pectinatus haikarae]|uniref:LTA synthase family protein n=1 Tax=Pectinatus haikarae TaxID=349096 RepID=UPI0018C6D78C|nr:alkaline phosphatase family protein [Pectinatus haikarae]
MFRKFSLSENKWNEIFNVLIKGLKCYLYFWLILSFFRIVFIINMHDYISEQSNFTDIENALFLGMRMSMQTVGIMVSVALFALLLGRIFSVRWGTILMNVAVLLELAIACILFAARFPYYRVYHSGFNQMLFTAVHEDWSALFQTMIEQFSLPVRLSGAVFFAAILFFLWKKFLVLNVSKILPEHLNGRVLFLLIIFLLARFSLFGGSWSWQSQIDWENSAITKDAFLNEVILDDGQAIYRAYRMQQRNAGSNGLSYTAEDVKQFAAALSGKKTGNSSIDHYLVKQAQGAIIKKPGHIFLIISESYANWPLLDEYADLHIADGVKELIAQKDTAYCSSFLPNGSSTVNALMGTVTNFADANLYLTTMVDKMKEPYSTATAPQMKKLGYAPNFYYAGPSSWENIEKFTKAQGFDNFYSRNDLTETSKGSVWGADDKDLYNFVLANTDESSSFNVILNVSNHSPFEVDLKANDFPSGQVTDALAPQYRNDEQLLKELGHFWYADKMLADFIDAMKNKYPDSLFIIVGDHADRYNIEKNPSMYKRYAIPFIINGRGISRNLLPKDAAGSQIDIFPTLVELIAPKGFTYYSVGRSLTLNNKIGANYAFAITNNSIGKTEEDQFIPEVFAETGTTQDSAAILQYADAIRAVSWWKAEYGDKIDSAVLKLAADSQ